MTVKNITAVNDLKQFLILLNNVMYMNHKHETNSNNENNVQ